MKGEITGNQHFFFRLYIMFSPLWDTGFFHLNIILLILSSANALKFDHSRILSIFLSQLVMSKTLLSLSSLSLSLSVCVCVCVCVCACVRACVRARVRASFCSDQKLYIYG